MSYQWVNNKVLDLLDAQGSNNELIFNAGTEKATVHITDDDIESVKYEMNLLESEEQVNRDLLKNNN